MRKILLVMMQLMVAYAWCDDADVVITQAGTYTGVVRSNQDQRSADITYLVKVPEWKRAHVEIKGVREAKNTEQQTIKAGIEADGSYRQFIFEAPNDRQTSVDSRGDIAIQLMAQCSPDGENVDKGYYDHSGYWHSVWVKEYYSYFYCNLNYTLKVTYEDVAPDLTILSLTTTPKDSSMRGEQAMLNFTVRNVGECWSAATTATIRDGETILKRVEISGLAEWGTLDFAIELPKLAVGSHELSVDISPVSGETYTSNNRKAVPFLVCNRTPFTVRFNANGGVGKMEDQNFICGTSQILHMNQYHREGYRFLGWSRTKDGEAVYADGEEVCNLTWRDETVELFAVWKKVNYFTFKFNSNGGSGIMESQDVELDVEAPLRKNTFTKEGCVFVGWSTISGGCSFGRNQYAPIRDEAKVFVWDDAELYKVMCSDYLSPFPYVLSLRFPYLDCGQPVISLYAVWGRVVNSSATCSSNLSFTTSAAMPWSEVDTPKRAKGADATSLDARSFCSPAFAPAATVKVSHSNNWIAVVVEGPGVVKFRPGAACLGGGGIAFSIDGWRGGMFTGIGAFADYYSSDVEVYWYDVEEWEIPAGKHLLTWSMFGEEMYCNKGSYFNNVWLNGVEWIPDPIVTPEAPVNVVASDGTNPSGVYITWSEVATANTYEVYRAENISGAKSSVGVVATPYFTDETAIAGVTYWYFVKAVNAAGVSDYSLGDDGFRKTQDGVDPAAPTYGPWGEAEAVKNPDRLGPTMLTDMTVSVGGKSAVEGDVVAVFRDDTGALCGLGKVMDDSGTLTVVCYAPKGVLLSFKVWISESGVDEAVIVSCDNASKLVAPDSGAFYSGHSISCDGESGGDKPSPSVPIITASISYTSYVKVSWASDDRALSYNIYRATSTSRPSSPWKTNVTSPYYDYMAAEGVTYYYWVEAAYPYPTGSLFSSYDYGRRASGSSYVPSLSPGAIAGIAVGSAAVVGVAGHFIGCAISEAIGQKKGNPTYKQFKAMKLVVPELDARGITYKNKLIYHPAKGTLTGRIVLTVQKGNGTKKIRAKAKGSLKDGVITGTLDAKGLGTFDFTVK